LVILVSLTILVIDIFGIVEQEVISEAILAILALVSFGTLTTRTNLKSLDHSLDDLNRKIDGLDENLNIKELSKLGVQNAWEKQSYNLIDQRLREARKEIYILETWIAGVTPLPAGLIASARRGVSIRILLLDPKSAMAKQRLVDQQFGHSTSRPIVAFETLQDTILKNNLQDHDVEVRFYDALPPFSLYMVDEWILMGFFWHNHSSIEGPHLEVFGKSSTFGWYIFDTFSNLWHLARPIPTGTQPNENN
jgi:hypothetical protein